MNTRLCTLTAIVVLGMSLSACSGGGSSGGGAPSGAGAASQPASHALASVASAGAKTSQQVAVKASDVDTCKLITPAEAAKALGEPVRAAEHDKDQPTACDWQATKDLPVEMVYVDVFGQFDQIYGSMDDKQMTDAFVLRKVSGVGDKAFTQSFKADKSGSNVGDVFAVKKGDVALSFTILRPTMSKQQGFAADKVLAQAALGRL